MLTKQYIFATASYGRRYSQRTCHMSVQYSKEAPRGVDSIAGGGASSKIHVRSIESAIFSNYLNVQ